MLTHNVGMRVTAQLIATRLAFCCLLLGCHAGDRAKDDPALTPLMNAARDNNLLRVRDLIAHGANVEQKTADGRTALYEAIERLDLNADNLPVVDALLKGGPTRMRPSLVRLIRWRCRLREIMQILL